MEVNGGYNMQSVGVDALTEIKNSASEVGVVDGEISKLESEIIKREIEISQCRSLRETLTLGVESNVRKKLNYHINTNRSVIEELKSAIKQINYEAGLGSMYHKINLNPLSAIKEYSKGEWAPALSVYNVNGDGESHLEFKVSNILHTGESRLFKGEADKFFTKLPVAIRCLRLEMLRLLALKYYKLIGYDGHVRFQFKFSGMVPPSVKTEIEKAEKLFKDNIFLVQEPSEFTVTVGNIPKDPLIIGIDQYENAYLIDSFDETNLEMSMFFTKP